MLIFPRLAGRGLDDVDERRDHELSAEGLEEGTHEDLGGLTDRAQAALANAMFDRIEDDSRTAGTNLKLGLHRCKAVLALYASALSREPVELGGFDPPEDLFEKLGEAPRA